MRQPVPFWIMLVVPVAVGLVTLGVITGVMQTASGPDRSAAEDAAAAIQLGGPGTSTVTHKIELGIEADQHGEGVITNYAMRLMCVRPDDRVMESGTFLVFLQVQAMSSATAPPFERHAERPFLSLVSDTQDAGQFWRTTIIPMPATEGGPYHTITGDDNMHLEIMQFGPVTLGDVERWLHGMDPEIRIGKARIHIDYEDGEAIAAFIRDAAE